MRVTVLDHTAREGGAELALLRLVEELRGLDEVELGVLLFEDGPLRERLAEVGAAVRVLPLDARVATTSRDRVLRDAPRSAVTTARFIPRLARALRASGADVVVATSLKSAVLASVAAPLAGRPWVWHLHDRLADDYLPRPLVLAMRAIAATGPRAVVVNSRATLATLPGPVRRRSTVVHPGLPRSAFAGGGRASQEETVGILGRISPTKGQREFLIAAAAVAAARPGARFAVVGGALFGEDEYERELHSLASELGIADRVEFTGWVADPGRWMRRLSVLVHASPVPEPFGQVVVEAMAAGTPVVATAAGGVPEILDPASATSPVDGVRVTDRGMLVRPGDARAIADAVLATLDDASARARRTAAARKASEAYAIERTADGVVAVWRRATRRRSAPRTPRR